MRDEHRKDVGAAIATLRERQGWSQRQLATWVGLDQSALSRIESGRRRVSADELQRFADVLRVSADDLLAGSWDRPLAPERDDLGEPPLPAPETFLEGAPRASSHNMTAAAPRLHRRPPVSTAAPEQVEQEEDAHESGGRLAAAPSAAPAGWRSLWFRQERDLQAPFPAHETAADSAAAPAEQAPATRRQGRSGASPAAFHAGLVHAPPLPPLTHTGSAGELPREVAGVVQDWFRLRELAGVPDSPLIWGTGHSAEGKTERFPRPLQPGQHGLAEGHVVCDRLARFWRAELHLDPYDGPVPDLVPLLEDSLGVQVIVARVAGGGRRYRPRHWPQTHADWQAARVHRAEAAPAGPWPADGSPSSEYPVGGVVTVQGVPFLFVNAARPVILQRFTLVHIFAHLALGHGDVVDERIVWSRKNPWEAAANDFAEEFLLPVRAARRWYECRGDPRPSVDTLLELGNAFGISAWAAFYRSQAAGCLPGRGLAQLRQELKQLEWELLPRQAFLGGVRDTLSQLTPGEAPPPGRYGEPAVLRVPAIMRRWAVDALRAGRLSLEQAAACLHVRPDDLTAQLGAFQLQMTRR